MNLDIKRLDANSDTFDAQLQQLLAWESVSDASVNQIVNQILQDVRKRGDQAIVEYTNKFDKTSATEMSQLQLSTEQLQDALKRIPKHQRDALTKAAERVRRFHERQADSSWQYQDDDGTVLGQKVTPIDKVGIYVPGGKASYPSSVLMNAIPAKVAGVAEIIMVVPTPNGQLNDLVLAAAAIAGVDQVFTIGGAQAIAALAYGTATVPKVDKITGPGNIFVATAKKAVFGLVGIDMIAGPSEILVIADGKTDPDWLAMDLFSQAEHDEQAQSILVCADAEYMNSVEAAMQKLLPEMERKTIIEQSINNRAAFILVDDLAQAVAVSNAIAPEHLELSVEDPQSLLESVRHAGAIFMGRYTAEALGDYCAGPNHVLPTSGTARFSSPLGVYDFQKRSSIVFFSEQSASDVGPIASVLARGEGLTAHARSAEYRIKK
ncbi:MAG: histidinol dehydrogenase [Pseudomonadales bacterium]|nr:histidinol dehydrogenase [Pseudomonadales bacterium]NRA18803.1 histidinol dehydrogenase [Oceanospirillaceae bacterium]